MEHPLNRSINANENDSCLSVVALIVVLALILALYLVLRAAVPGLPLLVHRALADLPSGSEQAAKALSPLR